MSLHKKPIHPDPSLLGKAQCENAHAIDQTCLKIAALAPEAGTRPRLFAKLHRWMEHLTFLRREESDLVDKISAIEEAHQKNRKRRLLRRARLIKGLTPLSPEPDSQPTRKGWRYLMLAILFMPTTSRQGLFPTLRND
ncbi:MAG: hypothetical protein PHW63_02165 [Alphaproteobacteria bacterium]|nr:hypothetical protein [Alphaproteobacteria bacterium]